MKKLVFTRSPDSGSDWVLHTTISPKKIAESKQTTRIGGIISTKFEIVLSL
jgi:hypothetical protein